MHILPLIRRDFNEVMPTGVQFKVMELDHQADFMALLTHQNNNNEFMNKFGERILESAAFNTNQSDVGDAAFAYVLEQAEVPLLVADTTGKTIEKYNDLFQSHISNGGALIVLAPENTFPNSERVNFSKIEQIDVDKLQQYDVRSFVMRGTSYLWEKQEDTLKSGTWGEGFQKSIVNPLSVRMKLPRFSDLRNREAFQSFRAAKQSAMQVCKVEMDQFWKNNLIQRTDAGINDVKGSYTLLTTIEKALQPG